MVFKPGETIGKENRFQPGQSGNPAGKPKGFLNLSTQIQNLMNEEEFAPDDVDRRTSLGTPMKAIVATGMKKARDGDTKWAEWLAKYGYGQKLEVEHSGEISQGNIDPNIAADFADFLKNKSQT
jgi:hypothetical protein